MSYPVVFWTGVPTVKLAPKAVVTALETVGAEIKDPALAVMFPVVAVSPVEAVNDPVTAVFPVALPM